MEETLREGLLAGFVFRFVGLSLLSSPLLSAGQKRTKREQKKLRKRQETESDLLERGEERETARVDLMVMRPSLDRLHVLRHPHPLSTTFSRRVCLSYAPLSLMHMYFISLT